MSVEIHIETEESDSDANWDQAVTVVRFLCGDGCLVFDDGSSTPRFVDFCLSRDKHLATCEACLGKARSRSAKRLASAS